MNIQQVNRIINNKQSKNKLLVETFMLYSLSIGDLPQGLAVADILQFVRILEDIEDETGYPENIEDFVPIRHFPDLTEAENKRINRYINDLIAIGSLTDNTRRRMATTYRWDVKTFFNFDTGRDEIDMQNGYNAFAINNPQRAEIPEEDIDTEESYILNRFYSGELVPLNSLNEDSPLQILYRIAKILNSKYNYGNTKKKVNRDFEEYYFSDGIVRNEEEIDILRESLIIIAEMFDNWENFDPGCTDKILDDEHDTQSALFYYIKHVKGYGYNPINNH